MVCPPFLLYINTYAMFCLLIIGALLKLIVPV